MRHTLILAVVLVAASCGGAPRPVQIAPKAQITSPQRAAAVARAVINARYGLDPATSDNRIIGRTEWFGENEALPLKWSRGMIVPVGGSTWFQAVAVVEQPEPGRYSVRVVGHTSLGAGRFDGLESVISSGDPAMPVWADVRVAMLQAAINHVLREYSAR